MNKNIDPAFMAELMALDKKLTDEAYGQLHKEQEEAKNQIVHFYFNNDINAPDESCLYEADKIPVDDLDDLYNSCKIYSYIQEQYRCEQCYKNAVSYKEKYENKTESDQDKIMRVLIKLLSKYIDE